MSDRIRQMAPLPTPSPIPSGLPEAETMPSVLIVDRSPDSRDVLKTVLQLRGVRILEAAGAEQGLAMARLHQPNLIVLDLESDAADQQAVQDQYAAQVRQGSAPLVLLGTAAGWTRPWPEDRTLTKPYHYGQLVRKIEELLAAGDVPRPIARLEPRADDHREPFAGT